MIESTVNKSDNDIILQSNDLIEAKYDTDLTATEHKIIRYALGKVRNATTEFPSVTFSVSEFLEAGGITGGGYYNRIEKIAGDLSRKGVKIKTDDKTTWRPWLSELVVYDAGAISLVFNPSLKNMLFGLEDKGQYTKYSYKYIGDMRSSYTIRLYELLKQYAPIGRREISLEVLRGMLGIGEKYKRYSNFKESVLTQAKKEMDEKKELTFDYEEIKKSRKVVGLIFTIKTNIKRKSLSTDKPNLENDAFIKEAECLLKNSYGFDISKNQLAQWSVYGIEMLNDTLTEIGNKEIRSPFAYISAILKSKKSSEAQAALIPKEESDIVEYIRGSKTKEIMPNWFVKNKLIDFLEAKETYSEDEIEELWDVNEDKIMNGIKM